MDATPKALDFASLAAGDFPGTRTSDWLEVDQQTITSFGLLTRDPDPFHIDPQLAAEQNPFGGPIAFGFQTLAMLTWLAKSAGVIPADAVHVVNYGFDRVRFVAPVRAGARIRGVFSLDGVARRAADAIIVTYGVEIEIERGDRPALVAKWLALYEGPDSA